MHTLVALAVLSLSLANVATAQGGPAPAHSPSGSIAALEPQPSREPATSEIEETPAAWPEEERRAMARLTLALLIGSTSGFVGSHALAALFAVTGCDESGCSATEWLTLGPVIGPWLRVADDSDAVSAALAGLNAFTLGGVLVGVVLAAVMPAPSSRRATLGPAVVSVMF